MALPELQKSNAQQARETKAAEKNAEANITNMSILQEVRLFTKTTADTITRMFALQAKQFEIARLNEGKQIEKDREAGRKKKVEPSKDFKKQFEENYGFPFLGVGNMLAGIAALAGAAVGLRGWEAGAIKSLSRISRIGPTITKGMTSLRTGVLKVFGLTPAGKLIRDPTTGRFLKAPPLGQQISKGMTNFRTSILKMFGLGADGRLLPRQTPQGFQRASVFTRMTKGLIDGVTKIFQPIKAAGQIVGKSLGGAFGGILRTIGSLGGFAKLFGTILKPIGIVFSLFDGVKTFMNTEGSLFDKINAGIAAALGDFVGAPLDLLKSGLSWVAKTLLGEDNFISKFLDSFKIEKVLKDIIATPGKILSSAFTYITRIFNPEDGKTRGDVIMEPINFILEKVGAFFDSIKNFFKDKIVKIGQLLGFDLRSEEEIQLEKLQNKQKKLQYDREKLLEEQAKTNAELQERQVKLREAQEKLKILQGMEATGKLSSKERGQKRMLEMDIARITKRNAVVDAELTAELKENEKKLLENSQGLESVTEELEKLNKVLEGATGQTPSGNGAADVLAFQNAARQSVLSATAPPVFQTNDNSVSSTQIENKYTGGDRILPVSGYGLYTQAI